MITIYLIVNILVFGPFGLMMLFGPDKLFNSIGVDISGGDGRYEIRSMYGGISVAAAVLCGLAIKNPALQPAAAA